MVYIRGFGIDLHLDLEGGRRLFDLSSNMIEISERIFIEHFFDWDLIELSIILKLLAINRIGFLIPVRYN